MINYMCLYSNFMDSINNTKLDNTICRGNLHSTLLLPVVFPGSIQERQHLKVITKSVPGSRRLHQDNKKKKKKKLQLIPHQAGTMPRPQTVHIFKNI